MELSNYPFSEKYGWIQDKYGLSWQIVSKELNELINSSDKEKAERVMSKLLKMKKLDINKLKEIYEQ